MFGAFVGDIVGSKYEFRNIKTKAFPLFSQGCDYTDDTIMTVAVAKAIMLSRTEQFEGNGDGRGFQEFLVEIMQDFAQILPVRMAAALQNGSGSKTRSLTEATEGSMSIVGVETKHK